MNEVERNTEYFDKNYVRSPDNVDTVLKLVYIHYTKKKVYILT